MGWAVVIEAAGEPGGCTDLQLQRFANELDSARATTLSTEDHSSYGAVIPLADVDRVGEALGVAVGHFGAAVDFSGLPAWPIARVELTGTGAGGGPPSRTPPDCVVRTTDPGQSPESGVRRRGSWRGGRRRPARR